MNTNAIQIIRHSLATAAAALDMIETSDRAETQAATPSVAVVDTISEQIAATDIEAVLDGAPNEGDEILFNQLHAELDGRYALRTITELREKLGISREKMISLLDAFDVAYVTKTRRSDNAPLIGLDSRN